jgi:hypothetical protein
MRIRLVRKLAERIDGVDLSGCTVGDVVDFSPMDAGLLLAEGWGLLERRRIDRAEDVAKKVRPFSQ